MIENLPAPYRLKSTTDEETLARALLPNFRDPKKTDYLVLRSVCFTHEEALRAIKIPQAYFEGWTTYDEDFRFWANENLRNLQKGIGNAVLRAQFMRNVFLQLHIDQEVLAQRAFERGSMDSDDREDAREAGRRYSASNIASMLRVLEDDKIGGSKTVRIELEVDVSEGEAEAYLNSRVRAKKLLKDMEVQLETDRVLDAESRVVE